MAAVLEDAIGCVSIDLRSATARQLKQFEQASQWFAAEDESEWTFSFENICEALGIHPGYLRSLIQSSAAGKQNRAAPRANRARSSRRHTPITLGTGS